MDKEGASLAGKIRWLIVFRVVLVTALLGLPLLLNLEALQKGWSIRTFYFLIGSTYFLTILYILALYRKKALLSLAFVQLTIDLLFETSLIAVTGGIQSPFVFLYIITIVSSSIFFRQNGGVLVASGATFLFGTLINLQYFQVPPFQSSGGLTGRDLYYILSLYMITFFTVGILSSRLSKKLHDKEVGFLDLQVFQEVIVQSMPSGLITTDMIGRITSFNRSATEITGFESEDILGKIWWERFSWDDIQDHYHDFETSGTTQRFEGEILNKKGERTLLGVTISALRNEQGKQIGIIGTFQDLTQIRNLEEAIQEKERLATIGEMAAGMAHEIRNPLASLSGSIQVLNKELRLDDEEKTLLRIAVKETERLNTIITQFLLYAKPSPPQRQRVNLHALLSETTKLIKNNPEYNDRINVTLQKSTTPLMILIDPDQIKQVFWNLAINAFQAMPRGGTLSVSARRFSSKKENSFYPPRGTDSGSAVDLDQVEIIFKDTGEGIQKENFNKIFYPFFTTKNSGSGLGLSIVQRVIEEHFGKIEVRSQPGGTSFHILLPWDELASKPVSETAHTISGEVQANNDEPLRIEEPIRSGQDAST